MSFLNPLFLFALFAIGLPLVIHLLNLRKPKKIAFSTLTFFQQLQNTTLKRIRIKRYLLLFLRVAAIICLALVLARPFLPPGLHTGFDSNEPALNAILIDNSISMDRIGSKGPLIDYAKEIAEIIQRSSNEDDRFILQVTNGEAENNSIYSSSNLLNSLEGIKVQPAGNFTGERLNQLIEQLLEAPFKNKKLFIISDGQSSQFRNISKLEDDQIVVTYIDAGVVDVQNTSVQHLSTSTNMIGANIPFTIHVDVINQGEIPAVNQFVALEFDGEPAGQYSLSLQPDESRTFSFTVTPNSSGSIKGRIIIEGDDFHADNIYYFSVQVPEKRSILWIEETSSSSEFISYTGAMLRAAGENDAQLNYDKITSTQADAAEFNHYDAIILDGLKNIPEFLFQGLMRYVQSGNGLVFFPSENGDINNYNQFLAQFNAGRFGGIQGNYASFNAIALADELQTEHQAFRGLFDVEEDEALRFDAPGIYYYLKLIPESSGTALSMLRMNNGDAVVLEKRFGEGQFIISAIGNDPGWSNFPVKPLFAPFYYRLMLYAAASDEGGFQEHILGNIFEWTGNIATDNVVIKNGNEEIIPNINVVPNGVQVRYFAREWQNGWISVSDEDNEFIIAVNLNKEESSFNRLPKEDIEELIGAEYMTFVDAGSLDEENLQSNILSSGFGKEIWNWFMFAALLFLIAETCVSVFYKTEHVD